MGKNEPEEGLSQPFISRITWVQSVASIIVACASFNASIPYHYDLFFESLEDPCTGIHHTYNSLLRLGLSVSYLLPLECTFIFVADYASGELPFPQMPINHFFHIIIPCFEMTGV